MRIVACGIFQLELERILQEIRSEWASATKINVIYTAPALHVNYADLRANIVKSLDAAAEEKMVLLFGSMCHPEISEFKENYPVITLHAKNCIELILGTKMMDDLGNFSNIFYMTPGWLQNWKRIFKQAQGWDEIDARQNFGLYEKILLLDTGVSELNEEDILEFFEYTQVPIEIVEVELSTFKENVTETLKKTFAS
ncbi:DUF1638 domain-containing protein [Desulfosporosinus sp. SB140]|uniref:DUF1638 domain-containing protein n=1 Tax=Desulfosporosinus paludis TaxID=3115649 RepID=UPI00388DCF40